VNGARRTVTRTTTPTTRYILVAIGLVALAVLIWKISYVVPIAFGGIVGAAALRGLARPLRRWTRLGERWSLAIVLLMLLAIAGALVLGFGRQVSDEVSEMQRLLPSSVARLEESLQQFTLGRSLVDSVRRLPYDSHLASNVGLAAGAIAGALADAMLILFLSVYFAFTPGDYLEGALRLFPPGRRHQIKEALLDAGEALLRWLLAQLAAMLIIGTLVGIALGLLGVPLALLLAVVAGLLEFIPVVGPILFTIPGVLIAFTRSPTEALYVLLAYIAVQQVEGNLVIPLLQGWAVRLPAAITLLSVVIGGILFGVPGVVFATPLAVVAMTLVKHLYVEDTLEKPKPPSAAEIVAARRS
jgi:predicted PurR-regulated permease PerM